MNRYHEALEKVKTTIECKYNDFGSPTAYHIHNEDEYRLVLECVNLGHMSCYDYIYHYNYDYKGADWYFFKHDRMNNGMDGTISNYWQETLTEKKKKFEKFCKQFED